MIKYPITYTDFNDNEVTDDFYFHLSKIEIMELEIGTHKGLEATIKAIVAAENAQRAWELVRQVVLKAVGYKSDDGKRFIKDQKYIDEFEQSPAFDKLVFDILQEPQAAEKFFEGMAPKQTVEDAKRQARQPQDRQQKQERQNLETQHIDTREPAITEKSVMEMTPEEFTAWKAQQG